MKLLLSGVVAIALASVHSSAAAQSQPEYTTDEWIYLGWVQVSLIRRQIYEVSHQEALIRGH